MHLRGGLRSGTGAEIFGNLTGGATSEAAYFNRARTAWATAPLSGFRIRIRGVTPP
jgi:hypothetical protein